MLKLVQFVCIPVLVIINAQFGDLKVSHLHSKLNYRYVLCELVLYDEPFLPDAFRETLRVHTPEKSTMQFDHGVPAGALELDSASLCVSCSAVYL